MGGAVRDAILARPPGPELDLVVEGDAIALAARAGRGAGRPRGGASALSHGAVVRLDGGRHVDLVSARTETYARPGALPTVGRRHAGRRPGAARLHDQRHRGGAERRARRAADRPHGRRPRPRGGPRPRACGPTPSPRIPAASCAAARYAARLGFALAPETEAAARDEAPSLDPGSSARVTEELRRLLDEPDAAAGLALGCAASSAFPGSWRAAAAAIGRVDAARARPRARRPAGVGAAPRGAVAPDALARAALPRLGARDRLAEAARRRRPRRPPFERAAAPSDVDRLLRRRGSGHRGRAPSPTGRRPWPVVGGPRDHRSPRQRRGPGAGGRAAPDPRSAARWPRCGRRCSTGGWAGATSSSRWRCACAAGARVTGLRT